MTDEVAAHVLAHNHDQTLALSLMQRSAVADLDAHAGFMAALEREDRLDRALEGLPDPVAIAALRQERLGLTRPELSVLLAYGKNDLFDAGADLATPGKGKGPGGARLTVTAAQVTWLENEIDRLNAELAPLKSFVLPGGFAAAAYLHLARTIVRRAERLVAELVDKPDESVTPELLKYVNRLSDYLFVAARYANDKGAAEVLWRPGENR